MSAKTFDLMEEKLLANMPCCGAGISECVRASTWRSGGLLQLDFSQGRVHSLYRHVIALIALRENHSECSNSSEYLMDSDQHGRLLIKVKSHDEV
jgi:hypothetical protein